MFYSMMRNVYRYTVIIYYHIQRVCIYNVIPVELKKKHRAKVDIIIILAYSRV